MTNNVSTNGLDQHKRRADQYNDPKHNYLHYWNGRLYEHLSEEIAIKRLLKNKRFKKAVDVGGGYGRLSVLLENYADKVILAEPSQQQLDLAEDYLKDHPKVERCLLQADDLKFENNEVDLVTMIRVMHHLPNPSPEFNEIARILSPKGYAIIEVANFGHARNRLRYMAKGKQLPAEPVDIRSAANRRDSEIPFVNHNPKTVISELAAANLKVVKALSVSNLRSPSLKKFMPRVVMLSVEKLVQRPLASVYFGPSIFFLVRKIN